MEQLTLTHLNVLCVQVNSASYSQRVGSEQ